MARPGAAPADTTITTNARLASTDVTRTGVTT